MSKKTIMTVFHLVEPDYIRVTQIVFEFDPDYTVPLRRSSAIRSIESFGFSKDQAQAWYRTAMTDPKIEKTKIDRGNALFRIRSKKKTVRPAQVAIPDETFLRAKHITKHRGRPAKQVPRIESDPSDDSDEYPISEVEE